MNSDRAAEAPEDCASALRSIATHLRAAERVVLTTHITPDGDGLGSALALSRAIRRSGREAQLVNCSSTPSDLRFLSRKGEFQVYDPKRHDRLLKRADTLIATDIGGAERLGKMLPIVREIEATKVVLDHHEYSNDLFDLACIDQSASCTAEIVWELLRNELGVTIDLELAEPLYVGLVSDTGHFAYSQTTVRAHSMAGHLLEAGVDPHQVWQRLHCQLALPKLRFLGHALTRLETAAEGQVVWLEVTLAELRQFEVLPRDGFEVINHMLKLKGAQVAVFLMEIDGERTKLSMRSSGRVDVCRIAQRHGGGGHRFASGCIVQGLGLRAAREAVVAEFVAELTPDPAAPGAEDQP